MPDRPVLYRKRLIPDECVRLDDDELLLRTDSVLVTRWNTIRPKKNLKCGMSVYLPERGWKISRFIGHDGRLLCFYCDIIDTEYDAASDTYVFTDLLADVLIYPDGSVRVVDLDEVGECLEKGLLTIEQACICMRRLDAILNKIYNSKLLPQLEQYWSL